MCIRDRSTTILPTLLENYKTYGVEQYPSHKVKEFRMDAVVCENKDGAEAVSYTHLDVYKRQVLPLRSHSIW